MENLHTKLELLSKNWWNVSDLRRYINCSQHIAERLIAEAKDKYSGNIESIKVNCASVDSIIKALGGTSRENEIKCITMILSFRERSGQN